MPPPEHVELNNYNVNDSSHDGSRKGSYWTLLKNPQMAVLCFSRLSDPMATTSIYSYLFFQLRYLSPDASEAIIAMQAGVLVGARTFAKVCTSVLWGMLADSTGRKGVMLVGLVSSGIASVSYGFSTSFSLAIFWQVVRGAMSCNVSMARTVVAELPLSADPKVRSRSLLLLVLMSSVGMLLGPLIGGFANGQQGLGVLSTFPYALPNLIIGAFYGIAALGVVLVVPETLDRRGLSPSRMRASNAWNALRRFIRGDQRPRYDRVSENEQQSIPLTSADNAENADDPTSLQNTKLTWRQIWTPQVVCTMITHFIITGHISTFATVWAIFLSTPVATPSSETLPQPTDGQQSSRIPLFGGGVGLGPPEVGVLMTGGMVVGIAIQAVVLPRLVDRMGTVRVWRRALWLFPFAYFLAPFPAPVASRYPYSPLPNPSEGPDSIKATGAAAVTWITISAVMLVFMIARTGAQPPMVILINECVPHPSSRGTVNSIGTTAANLARSIFPLIVMAVYSAGLRSGFVAAAFWLLSLLAFVAVAASRWVAKGLDDGAVLKKKRAPGDAARDDAMM